MGSRVADRLSRQGNDVVRVARSYGVDVRDRAELECAFADAQVVVDALNLVTLSGRRATAFFEGAAHAVSAAAEAVGVQHIVCVSIVGAADPQVSGALGYYRAKAAQESVYRAGAVPLTLALTTQWFELTHVFLRQIRLGPVAVVPGMRVQPVAADAAADFVTRAATEAAPSRLAVRQLAGPEQWDTAGMARRLTRIVAPQTRVVRVPMPMRILREGGLLPGPSAHIDERRYEQWLADLATTTRQM